MGKRITIHRPERLKYERPPPDKRKKKEGPRVAHFYADDVVWGSSGPIRATHAATPEGMRLIEEDGSLGPVEEGVEDLQGVSYHQHGGRPAHGGPVQGGRYSDHLTREDDAPDSTVTVRVRNTAPGDRVHVAPFTTGGNIPPSLLESIQAATGGEFAHQTADYTYFYSGGNPVRRQHNISGDIDTCEIDRDIRTREYLVIWSHTSGNLAVDVQRVSFDLFGESAGLTLAAAHRVGYPATAALSFEERRAILRMAQARHLASDATDEELLDAQNTPVARRIPPHLENTMMDPNRSIGRSGPAAEMLAERDRVVAREKAQQRKLHPTRLDKWRAWQKDLDFHMGHGAFDIGALAIGALYLYGVFFPAYELLQLLHQ